MLEIDFNSFNINNLSAKSDFEKNVISFCKDWYSSSPTLWVQTSGSTGQPKRMEVEKFRMRFSANATCDFLELTEESTALLALPIDYISGKMMVVRAIEKKMKLYIAPPNLNPLSQLDFPIDFCALTPLQVENSLNQLHLIKNLIIGGAAISENLKKKIQKAIPHDSDTKVFETFGMTETLSHIALKQVFPTNEDFFTVFEGVNLSLDHRNCLAIYAPDLCKDLVQTNDVVALITPNQFRFLGRADFIINSGGAKIHPEDLEKKLKTVLDVELAFVGVKDEVLGEKLVLCVEYIPGLPNEKQKWLNDIHGFSFEKSFYKPKEIFFIRKLPRTENGKINRNELMQMITDKPEV